MHPRNLNRIYLAALLLLAACGPGPAPSETPAATLAAPSATPAAPASPTPTRPPTATPAATATSPLPTPPPALCSPLAGIPLERLAEHLTNPFQPPPPGSDDPHQGIDLAVFLPGSRVAVSGDPVLAVAAGRLSLVLADRFPWGNALLVEVPLDAAPPGLPAPVMGTPVSPTLTCPGVTDFEMEADRRSLYILYAHLEATGGVRPGENVACGQELGTIGSSGNAFNPHLHLEMRLGPAGAVFPGMAHYTGSASPAEMDAYCLWRVSGLFQLVDPAVVLGVGAPE